ncbi:phytoene desaturase family protein [Nocardia noduli]|uniref:phytoene desaturase family protein n=1 Tax=Nocardia noduli TaxID=2815722 RepID=UPI001C21F5C7|nr:NAD(P)/FAD-dependent oxidoreductase [Nocardia noduli]
MADFDAVVIGAGNAGLTAAATLQRAGARTLLVERHNVPGGSGTSFRRGRFEFEVALHQLSGVGVDHQPGLRTGLFRDLDIVDRLEFVQESELYRAFVPGQVDLTLPAGWGAAVDTIEDAFPGNGIRARAFFDLVRKVTVWQTAAQRGRPGDQLDPLLFAYGLRSAKDVLDEFFDDDRLKFALGAYWTYLGQPPSQLPFLDFAMILYVYVQFKPWHIRGGSQAMSSAILDSFLRAGGTVRFNTSVHGINTDGTRVTGIRLDDGETVSAAEVVSNASLPSTYAMLEGIAVPSAARRDLGSRRVGVSGFVLHMGLDASAAELGFTTSTSLLAASTDDDVTFAAARSLEPTRLVCLSSYDVAPIGFAPSGATHVSLTTLHYADPWTRLAPAEYARAKFAYAETLLDMVEHMTPGIRDVIEEVDVATPLTMMRYLGHPGGAIYGYQQDFTETWLFRDSDKNSHVPGLHLAGAWTVMGGFQPTLIAGARVAQQILRTARTETTA